MKENNYHGVRNAYGIACNLNVVCQKLIPHSFVSHPFISYLLSLVHISEIKVFALRWENY